MFTIPSRCDSGFRGTECQPENPLSSTIMSDFENPDTLKTEWQEIIGGEIVKPEEGCGVISSGSSLYFNKVLQRAGRLIKAHPVGFCGAQMWLCGKEKGGSRKLHAILKCVKQHTAAQLICR